MKRAERVGLRGGLGLLAAVAVSVLALSCAQPSGGGGVPGPTTTSTTTTTTTTWTWTTPLGTWYPVNMTCYPNVFGTYYPFAQAAAVNVKAPVTVNRGDIFEITMAPGGWSVPTQVEGYTVLNVNTFEIRFPLPANVTFLDANMSSGFNMGPGYPSFAVEGQTMVYRVPGPFQPGVTVTLPQVRLTLQAANAPGAVETRFGSLINLAQFELGVVGTQCLPNIANQLFTTTFIL